MYMCVCVCTYTQLKRSYSTRYDNVPSKSHRLPNKIPSTVYGKPLKLFLKVIQAITIALGCQPIDKDTTQF